MKHKSYPKLRKINVITPLVILTWPFKNQFIHHTTRYAKALIFGKQAIKNAFNYLYET